MRNWWRFTLGCLLLAAIGDFAFADPPALWDETPYRVQIDLELAGPQLTDGDYPARLERSLRARLASRLGSFWRVQIRQRKSVLAGEPTPVEASSYDKKIGVRVEEGAELVVAAREYDATVSGWGPAARNLAGGHANLPEVLIVTIIEAFRPLCAFDVDTEDASIVRLTFRGATLAPTDVLADAADGAVLLPYSLRRDRDGMPIRRLSQPTPWTYLIRDTSLDEEAAQPSARVVSNKRLPFGTRRGGRVEQIAIKLPTEEPQPTVLRIVDQDDPTIGLRGYEVFTTKIGQPKPLQRLARTDGRGAAVFPPSLGPVMAYVKCGSSVVAALPIIPGATDEVTVPLLNEVSRLEAETRLNQLQEDLLDVSAQRSILMQRAKSQLALGEARDAELLLREIDRLPGRAQFSQRLNNLANLYRADNPISQRRLERLYDSTRAAIATAFEPTKLRQLESQVLTARDSAG